MSLGAKSSKTLVHATTYAYTSNILLYFRDLVKVIELIKGDCIFSTLLLRLSKSAPPSGEISFSTTSTKMHWPALHLKIIENHSNSIWTMTINWKTKIWLHVASVNKAYSFLFVVCHLVTKSSNCSSKHFLYIHLGHAFVFPWSCEDNWVHKRWWYLSLLFCLTKPAPPLGKRNVSTNSTETHWPAIHLNVIDNQITSIWTMTIN